MIKKYILLIALLAIATPIFAQKQEDCLDALDKAKRMYNEGDIYKIAHVLAPHWHTDCFSSSQKAEAYRMLGLVYEEIDKVDSLKYCVEKMLKLAPEYHKRETDVKGFSEMLQSFEVFPKISVGALVGINSSKPKAIREFSLFIGNEYNAAYQASMATFFGLEAEYALKQNLYVSVGFTLQQYIYKYKFRSVVNNTTSETANIQYNYSQHLSYFELPINFRYYFGKHHHYKPFISAGYYFGSFTSSYRNGKTTITEKVDVGNDFVSETRRLYTGDLHQAWNQGLRLGAGFSYHLKRSSFAIELAYQRGLYNFINPKNRYSNDELLFVSYDIEDDKTLNSFMLSFKYMYHLTYTVNEKKKK